MTGMNFEVKDILLLNWGACVDAVFWHVLRETAKWS
jgi:hypothetical protein